MAQITIQRTGELMRKLFSILLIHPNGMRAQEALNILKAQVQQTEYEKGRYKSGSPRFDKIVRFSTIDYVKAGWLLKVKGQWTVTETGKEAYESYKTDESFQRAAVKLYQEWRANRIDITSNEDVDGEVESTETEAIITYEQAEEQAWNEIANYLQTMNPYDFQKLVAALLRAIGYHVSWIAPPGKDGGVDVIAWNDPLGTRPPRIKVQVKREKAAINIGDVRSFMAVLGDDEVGIFVSASGFTKDAEDAARTQQSRKVTLVNLERLYELWIEYYEKLDQEARDRFPLKPIYFLAPET